MSENSKRRVFIISQPIVGPSDYICKDPSGWPVTYNRKESDEMLIELLGDFPLELALEAYLNSAPVRQVGMIIDTVQSHLVLAAKLTSADQIPLPALVAFWAKAMEMKKLQALNNVN
jgi:hypothetical protein